MKFKINNYIISAKSLKDAVKTYSCIKKLKDEDSDVEFLSEEERQAIEDYKKAISNTNDPKLLRLFSHILKEEIEHLEELQNEEVEDAVNDEKLMTAEEAKQMMKEDASIWAICLYVKDKNGNIISNKGNKYAFLAHSDYEYGKQVRQYVGDKPQHDFTFVTVYRR